MPARGDRRPTRTYNFRFSTGKRPDPGGLPEKRSKYVRTTPACGRAVLFCAAIAAAAFPWPALTHAGESPTLELIMSDADWIGNAPQNPYWADDGKAIYYEQKRQGENFRDLYRLELDSGAVETVDRAVPPADAARERVYDRPRSHVAWVDDGDLFVKSLVDRSVRRVTQSVSDESAPVFSADGRQLYYELDGQFHAYDLTAGRSRQLTNVQAGRDPDAEPPFDALRAHQLRTYQTVVEDKRRARASEQAKEDARADLPRALYLGGDYEVLSRYLSPSGDRLALVVQAAGADGGRQGKMPNYVTEDGYVSLREVRTRVGRNGVVPQQVLLADLVEGRFEALDFKTLPGISDDPLASLRAEAIEFHVGHGAERTEVEKALETPEQRPLQVQGAKWNVDGSQLALQLLAGDYKDRWLVTVAADRGEWVLQHRLTDEAWINYHHNEFGWLADGRRLWYLSEESGYSHLYLKPIDARRARALTQGNFVVREPTVDPRERYFYVVANPEHPGDYPVYRVPLSGGELERVSAAGGVSSFVLSPDGGQLLLSRSAMDRHPDLYLGSADGGEARRLTDTVSARFAAIDWVLPEIVEVPSSHVDRPIYSKLYLPPDFDSQASYPAVMFVHGAGYLQNAHFGWPAYFREFMFHTVLAEAGYVVLDMDYRASRGYGRDWRTAIYRNMGHPELEDYLDGIEYLVARHGVDRERIGIYGGSYGGFMTFMALFRAPGAFAAGAALRPVVDWMHYNNSYTGRILNAPAIDPEAYRRSSPINFVEGLQDPLLIATGMQDDNVFFQDSILLVQRLIELKKQDFQLAVYPLDGHSFTHPESWLDEYRRIFKLMEAELK